MVKKVGLVRRLRTVHQYHRHRHHQTNSWSPDSSPTKAGIPATLWGYLPPILRPAPSSPSSWRNPNAPGDSHPRRSSPRRCPICLHRDCWPFPRSIRPQVGSRFLLARTARCRRRELRGRHFRHRHPILLWRSLVGSFRFDHRVRRMLRRSISWLLPLLGFSYLFFAGSRRMLRWRLRR